MAEAQNLAPELHPRDEIQFIASHRPGLEDGHYAIAFQQTIAGNGNVLPDTTLSATRDFHVLGPQFTLNPQVVHATFPPAGSRGNFWNVLPHVILDRSTLPWERSACDAIEDRSQRPPWLLLLLFDPDEAPKPQQVTLGELKNKNPNPLWPGIDVLEPGLHDNDRVVVIDVPWTTLHKLLPETLDDFAYRNHARIVSRYRFTLSASAGSNLTSQLNASQFPQDIENQCSVNGLHISDHVTVHLIKDDERWRIIDVNEARHYEIYKPGDGNDFNIYEVESEQAVVIGNRLPKPGQRNVVHLVTVEDRFNTTGEFIVPDASGDLKIRLVSLLHWEFFCLDETKTFKGLLEGLNKSEGDAAAEASSSFHLPYQHIEIEAGGENGAGQAARRFLNSGFIPLPHHFRRGDRSVSWYHGPCMPERPPSKKVNMNAASTDELMLLPGIGPVLAQRIKESVAIIGHFPSYEDIKQVDGIGEKRLEILQPHIALNHTDACGHGFSLPASAADHLLLYDQTWGFFDASYAAAWELGRLLMLQNTGLALQLFNWKRRHAENLLTARHLIDFGYDLPTRQTGQTNDFNGFPEAVARWLNELTLLQHVPFNYLVPDERLLPPESLRFFTIDPVWIECLRDGAFSVGRAYESQRQQDIYHLAQQQPIPVSSGILLRSEVVAGWPGLHAEGYNAIPVNEEEPHPNDNMRCKTLRMERLSKNVLLCIFEGEVQMVDIHLKPETLHFGLDTSDSANINEEDPTTLVKKLRSPDGEQLEPPDDKVPANGKPSWIDKDTRLVDFVELAESISGKFLKTRDENVADFALQMVAGVDLVRFIRKQN